MKTFGRFPKWNNSLPPAEPRHRATGHVHSRPHNPIPRQLWRTVETATKRQQYCITTRNATMAAPDKAKLHKAIQDRLRGTDYYGGSSPASGALMCLSPVSAVLLARYRAL